MNYETKQTLITIFMWFAYPIAIGFIFVVIMAFLFHGGNIKEAFESWGDDVLQSYDPPLH